MRLATILIAPALVLSAPLVAQNASRSQTKTPAKPTKVVTRSDQLVTARLSNGSTRSFNCRKPENAKRKVCKR